MRVTLIVVLRCFDLVDLREEEKLRKYLRPESLVLGISTFQRLTMRAGGVVNLGDLAP